MPVSVASFRGLNWFSSFGPLRPSALKVAAGRVYSTRYSAVWRERAPALSALLMIAFLVELPVALHAQTVTATVNVGSNPVAVAVNPVTNTVYVANQSSNSVTVINGTTNSTATVNAGTNPCAIALNPVTNTVYVANRNSANVTVINGATNSTSTLYAGGYPQAIAVNPVTNTIYVASTGTNTVSAIDGHTNLTALVGLMDTPAAIAVNPVTNTVYVSFQNSMTVVAIDGLTNLPTTINIGGDASALAVNPVTNAIYAVSTEQNSVTVIDGVTNNTANVSVGSQPDSIAVNLVTNQVYVASADQVNNSAESTVTVIDGPTNNTTTVYVGYNPWAVAVNPMTNTVYVAYLSGGTLTAINGATNNSTAINVGNGFPALAVNPVTNTVYIANAGAGAGTVTVINGASSSQAATTTALTASPNPAAPGSAVNFTATVSNTLNGSSLAPTGTVVFLDYASPLEPIVAGTLIYPDGAVQMATEPLGDNGTTGFITNVLAGGIHTLFAVYAGNASLSSSSGELLEGIDLAPAITSSGSALFAVGQAGSFTVTTTGVPAPGLSVTSGTLPSGVSFVDNKNGTATMSGTPAGPGGTYNFTIKASNGVGTSASQSFTLQVDQVPAITSAAITLFTVGQAGAFTVKAIGVPPPGFSVTSGNLPSGVTLVDNTNGTATLSGTPAAGTAGNYTFTITANNGVGTAATQSFTLTVDQAPAITSAGSAVFGIGQNGTFTVTATGFPTPSISVASGALPGGLTLVDYKNGTATLSGTPTAGTAGTYPFTIKASNGVGTAALQSFTLTLGYRPVITSAASTTFAVGHAGAFTVSATGFPAPAFSLTYGTLPSGVTLVDNKNGTATLSSTAAAGPVGRYGFNITANNGVGPAVTQSFILTLGQAPTITSAASAAFGLGAQSYFTVTATGTPAPTFSETGDLPSGVTFNPFYGSLSGAPAPGTTGEYAITFTASNAIAPNAIQHFVLTVGFVPPGIGSVGSATFTVGQAGSFTVIATGAPKPTLFETHPLPSGLTFNSSTGVLSGTPAPGTIGTYPVLFTAVNGINPAYVQEFTLIVAPSTTSSTAITASPDPVTYGSNATFAVTVTPATASGTVVFFDDGVQFGQQTLSAGKAVFATSVLDAGTHYITATYVSNATYVGSSGTVVEVVHPAPLTVTASSDFMVAGGEVPEILPRYTGLMNHNTANSLAKQPTCSTAATPASPVGTYRSICSDGADRNYKFIYEGGTVTVYKPAAWVSPMSLSFGTQAVKTKSVTHEVTVSNTGRGPLRVTGISVLGKDEADFAETNTCGKLPAALAADASCTISVTFIPQAKGGRSAGLSLTTAAGTKTVALSGTGK